LTLGKYFLLKPKETYKTRHDCVILYVYLQELWKGNDDNDCEAAICVLYRGEFEEIGYKGRKYSVLGKCCVEYFKLLGFREEDEVLSRSRSDNGVSFKDKWVYRGNRARDQ